MCAQGNYYLLYMFLVYLRLSSKHEKTKISDSYINVRGTLIDQKKKPVKFQFVG